MRAALASALLVLAISGCRRDATEGSAADASASATPAASAVASDPAPTDEVEAGPTSRWSKTSSEPVELVVAPDRAAFIAFEAKNGGYVLHRGAKSTRLPREWFGAGPPRRDLSISADGARLGIPAVGAPGELIAVTVYETDVPRFLGRFAVPNEESPDGGGFEGKLSADGKYVVWTFTRRACMVTEIATGTLDVDGAKHKKCS